MKRTKSLASSHAPTLEEMNQVLQETWDSLPQDFRALCPELSLMGSEFPEEELLEELECESAYELLGFFYGTDTHESPMMFETEWFANTLRFFRRPILDYWAETGFSLKEVVTHVMVTEIGRHFGLSDHELALVEVAAGGRQTELLH